MREVAILKPLNCMSMLLWPRSRGCDNHVGMLYSCGLFGTSCLPWRREGAAPMWRHGIAHAAEWPAASPRCRSPSWPAAHLQSTCIHSSQAIQAFLNPQPTGRVSPCPCTGICHATSIYVSERQTPAACKAIEAGCEGWKALGSAPWLGTRERCGLPSEVGCTSCGLQMRAPGNLQVSRQALIEHSGIESA